MLVVWGGVGYLMMGVMPDHPYAGLKPGVTVSSPSGTGLRIDMYHVDERQDRIIGDLFDNESLCCLHGFQMVSQPVP
jgi:hypothetical protein